MHSRSTGIPQHVVTSVDINIAREEGGNVLEVVFAAQHCGDPFWQIIFLSFETAVDVGRGVQQYGLADQLVPLALTPVWLARKPQLLDPSRYIKVANYLLLPNMGEGTVTEIVAEGGKSKVSARLFVGAKWKG